MNGLAKRALLMLGGMMMGLLGGILGGWLLLNVLETSAQPEPLPALPAYDIEVVVEEAYINRVMLEGNRALVGGNIDLRGDGVASFAVQLAAGPLRPMVQGNIAFRTDGAGGLAVQLLRVKMGRLSLLRLVPRGVINDMNAVINETLVGRVGSKGLEVVAVGSDERSLRLYLAERR